MNIPFLDLKAQYRDIEAEFRPLLDQVLDDCGFIGGPHVDALEKEFADYCESKNCVAVNSGTDALRFAMMAAGIGSGDEVITVPNTFIATTEAISQTGAKPVLVDIEKNTSNLNVNLVEAAINSRTKAILPVHLYGQTADMDPILEIAERRNLIVIEDACQAHGALYKGRKAGSLGTAGCFSFYPGKNLGGLGEGGAVVTNDDEISRHIKMLRDHGQSQKYYHDMEGFNGRLDAIQAAALRIKLKKLPQWNNARREHARYYDQLLSGISQVAIPHEADYAQSVYHLYVIHVPRRDELQQFLTEKGIATGLHYPLPLHLQKAYANNGYKKGDFPIAEQAAERLLSLPMYPHLQSSQIEYVSEMIQKFYTA